MAEEVNNKEIKIKKKRGKAEDFIGWKSPDGKLDEV